jgi:hypothetical protein
MPVPDFQSLMLPVLRATAEEISSADLRSRVASELRLTEAELAEMLRSGRQTTFTNRTAWANVFLQRAGLIERVSRGVYRITDEGRNLLKERPERIDLRLLARYPSYVEWRQRSASGGAANEEAPAIFNAADGTWNQRAGVEERVRKKLELSIPNEAIRREALRFLALAIEIADEERSNAWYVRETKRGLRLMTGRLLACEIAPSKIRVSVIGPVGEDVRKALGAEAANDWEFKKVLGGLPHVSRGARGGSSCLAQARIHQLCRRGNGARASSGEPRRSRA